MIYCIADIHGELDRLQAMLKEIQFCEHDTLYILGDVIDRGKDGVAILKQIMAAPNMVMLLGNHEAMCLQVLLHGNQFGDKTLWMRNGGNPTYRDLIYHSTQEERTEIIRFIRSLPDHLKIEVAGKKYYLVHAYCGSDQESRIWTRPDPEWDVPSDDMIVIFGHTPTPILFGADNGSTRIWKGACGIDIDCGCGHLSYDLRRLACLRIDDMAEFYV